MNLINKLLIKPRTTVNLHHYDPEYGKQVEKRDWTRAKLSELSKRMTYLQYKLFADRKQALLIILQGTDTSGKDSTIRHVMNAFNPQSCRVVSFKVPTTKELSHDYLWRVHNVIPSKGEIAIFNRSHYEDVVKVRVHNLVQDSIWSQRYRQINDFERYLSENNIKIIKLFLHISKDEQKKRLGDRLNDPKKRWKITEQDLQERKYWNEYLKAHEDMITKCNAPWSPWYIIPSNIKWFRNLAVATVVVLTLEDMNLAFPEPEIDISKVIIE